MKKLLFTIVLFFSSTINAEIKVYDIEILLFEDASLKYINSEIWPVSKSDPISTSDTNKEVVSPNEIISSSINLEASSNNNSEIDSDVEASPSQETNDILLPESNAFTEVETSSETELAPDIQLEPDYPKQNDVINILAIPNKLLNEEALKITQSKNYNLLLHKAWRQTGLDQDNVIPMTIDSTAHTEEFIEKKPPGPLYDLETLDQKIINAFPHERKTYLQGTIKVELSRYLHVYTDLKYSIPENPLLPIALEHLTKNQEKRYPMIAHRKLRSGELHYIDHSLIGMLIKITPAITVTETNQEELVDEMPKEINTL